jgi:hypothetical protein
LWTATAELWCEFPQRVSAATLGDDTLAKNSILHRWGLKPDRIQQGPERRAGEGPVCGPDIVWNVTVSVVGGSASSADNV